MNINKLWLIVGCCILIIGFGLLVSYQLQLFDGAASASTRDLEIKTGMSFDGITGELKAENFIRSETIFKIYCLISGQARQLKAGRYILPAGISIPRLAGILASGPNEVSVIIFPGMTVKEIDEKLSSTAVIKPNDLVNFKIDSLKSSYPWLKKAQSLEGFLFPDTYNFFLGSGGKLVIEKFLDNFELNVLKGKEGLPYFENSDILLKTINLASLLEKEIPDYRESQLAAGILLKRLNAGIPLQVDATLIYAKCSGEFSDCPSLQEGDYKINSLYNTYLYGGLPKGPICNPGPEAVKAALNPVKSDYWYYLSDPKTKETIFSKTLDEHNQNRIKYLLNS